MSKSRGLGLIEYPPMTCRQGNPSELAFQLNATGEQVHFVGHIIIDGGVAAGSKTISSSGGIVHWRHGTTGTFVDAGTTVRVGLQDVSTSSPAQGDGTFDVSDDLVGGTDTLTLDATESTAMSSGTKNLTQGDLVAVVIELISRGGADDVRPSSVEHRLQDTATMLPAVMHDTGTPLRQAATPNIIIEFDDGTLGWFVGSTVLSDVGSISYDLDTTPDEYGDFINVPFPVTAIGASINVTGASTTSNFEVVLYEDPLGGTPTILEALTVDMAQRAFHSLSGEHTVLFAAEHSLSPSKTYGLSLRPTTTGNIQQHFFDVSDTDHLKITGVLPTMSYAISRTGNSGAFADFNSGTAKTRRFDIALILDAVPNDRGRAATHIGL